MKQPPPCASSMVSYCSMVMPNFRIRCPARSRRLASGLARRARCVALTRSGFSCCQRFTRAIAASGSARYRRRLSSLLQLLHSPRRPSFVPVAR